MIDDALNKFQDVIRHEILDLERSYARQLSASQAKWAANGSLSSSGAVLGFQEIARGATRAGSQVILSQLLRCITAYGVPLDDEAVSRAKTSLRDQINLHATVLRSRLLGMSTFQNPAFSGMKGQTELEFNQETQRVADRMANEIDLAAAASRRIASGSSPTLNFHGAVGIVQTGDANVAMMQQHIGAEPGAQIATVLSELLGRLDGAEAALGHNKDALKSLIQETIEETNKPSPNPLKVGSSLRTIAETVKFVGSLETAYTGLKPILSGMGIHIP